MPEITAAHPRIVMTSQPFGGALLVLGSTVIFGWLLQVPGLVRLAPAYAPMAPNTALCFILLGIALALPRQIAARHHVLSWLGASVALLSAVVFSQYIFSADLGVDHLFGADWLNEPRPYPTRMSPVTAATLALSGTALVLMQIARRMVLLYLVELIAYVTALVGTLAACAYAFDINFLLDWHPYQGTALHTGLGLILLGMGLWINLRHSRLFREHVAANNDWHILHNGAAILVLTVIASGLVTFVSFERQVEGTLKRGLELLLANRVDSFSSALDQGIFAVETIATRPAIRRELARLQVTPGHPEAMMFLRQAASSFLPLGFSAVAFHDYHGQVLVQAGKFATKPELRIPLAHPAGAELLWARGLVLRIRIPVVEGGKLLGTVFTERRLTQIEHLMEDIRGLGETGEMAVCVAIESASFTNAEHARTTAARGDRIACLPTRLTPEVFTAERHAFGQLLPMGHALNGGIGVVTAYDYRGQQVIAAYSPIPRTGLGMVVKMDANELYRPVLERSLYGLPLIAVMIAGGLLLLWRQVHPLAHRLVESEREIRELSLTDDLTGLRNRRGFMTLAVAEAALARRMQRSFLIFYTDLDGLKHINDTWGHAEGDRCIGDAAVLLRRTFRDTDILARLGGDEFAVLAFDNGEDNTGIILQRLRSNIEQFNRTAGRRYQVAMSVGVVRGEPASDTRLDEMLKQADAEMYRMKQARRA